MVKSKKRYLILFALAALAGFVLHGLYQAVPIWPVALFAPVRESLWEHLKILFWPCLAAAVFLHLRGEGDLRPRLACLLLMCGGMLGLSFWYHILIGGESVAADIFLFLLAVAGSFFLPLLLTGPCRGKGWELVVPLTVLLGGLLLLFTFFPPRGVLFVDLSGANTWSRVPC